MLDGQLSEVRPLARSVVGVPGRHMPGCWRASTMVSSLVDRITQYGHTLSMAITSVRSTYSLDVETMRRIDNLARRWDVSKSEVLRRAVKMADDQTAGAERVELLRELQRRASLTAEQVEAWVADVRAERDAWRVAGEEG